jgi:hypothetical protein
MKSLLLALAAVVVSVPVLASWDVIAQDLPKVAKVSQIPDDFKPKPLGKRKAVVERIIKVVPSARFDEEGWASVDGPNTKLEINVGREEDVQSIGFHGRGGVGDVEVVDRILQELGVRALDSQSGEFFSKGAALESHRKWRAHANQIRK